MDADHHLFVDGDAGLCGAILRHLESGRMRARTVFRMGDDAPVYHVDQVVEHDGDVRRWTRFTYDSPTSGTSHSGHRTDGRVVLDGRPAPGLADAVGGYGEHLLLLDLLRDGARSVSYHQFDEGDPDAGMEAAELVRDGRETTALLDGTLVDAERVRLVVGGQPTNTHWHRDGVVLKSDWCGAQSFHVDDLGSSLHLLDDEVAALVEEFLAHDPRAVDDVG